MDQSTDYDVIIVGAAISGATLMNILADAGLRVLVLDKEAGVLEIPRAAHIDDEVLRYFQHFGVVGALRDSYSPKGRFDFFDDSERMFLSFPESTELDQGYLDGYYFHQPDFEHFLRDRAVRQGVKLLEKHEVFDLVQHEDQVIVRYRDLADPERKPLEASAKYVVACDGSASFVRKHLGVSVQKLAEPSRHIIVDFRVKHGVKLPEQLGYCVWARIKKEGTTIYVHMPKDIKRLEFDVPDRADRAQFESKENVFQLLAPWVHRDDVREILRSNVYTYHSLIADRWMDGRVLLVGDAAHLSPPFLGQGACAAVRDVFNLGWKLARVVTRKSPASLLQTYQTERQPHATELVARAGKIGEMFKVIQRMSAEQLANMPPQVHTIARPVLGPGLHDAAASAGVLSPQPRLGNGLLMDQKIGPRFAVVGDSGVIRGMAARTGKILEQLDAVVIEDDGDSVQSALRALDGRVMVIRPDRYLLGVARHSEDLDRIVAGAARHLLNEHESAFSVAKLGEAHR